MGSLDPDKAAREILLLASMISEVAREKHASGPDGRRSARVCIAIRDRLLRLGSRVMKMSREKPRGVAAPVHVRAEKNREDGPAATSAHARRDAMQVDDAEEVMHTAMQLGREEPERAVQEEVQEETSGEEEAAEEPHTAEADDEPQQELQAEEPQQPQQEVQPPQPLQPPSPRQEQAPQGQPPPPQRPARPTTPLPAGDEEWVGTDDDAEAEAVITPSRKGRWSHADTARLVEEAKTKGRDFDKLAETFEGRKAEGCKRKLEALIKRGDISAEDLAVIDAATPQKMKKKRTR